MRSRKSTQQRGRSASDMDNSDAVGCMMRVGRLYGIEPNMAEGKTEALVYMAGAGARDLRATLADSRP